jgi:hypothetical protein
MVDKRVDIEHCQKQADTCSNAARITCYYCSRPLGLGAQEIEQAALIPESTITEAFITRCPHRGCHKSLPSCCVCLEPLKLSIASSGQSEDWTVWCSTCRHGGHKNHLRDWFDVYKECPVAGCACLCAEIDGAEIDLR